MSCSKPLPPFTFDLLCYLIRDQLERFSIVCRHLKNIFERYFGSKPYRRFHKLEIRRGLYALFHDNAQWHPDRKYYSAKQFFCWSGMQHRQYYSFAELHPYLGPTVRINRTILYLAEDVTYNPEHVTEMESLTHLWRDGDIQILHADSHSDRKTRAEDFQLILNSPTILQCQVLYMEDPQFSLKDYEVLYTVNVIVINHFFQDIANDYWPDFLEHPGVKPVVVLSYFSRRNIENLLDRLSKAFSSAVLPNTFKIVFAQSPFAKPLNEFREENKTSAEILELKKETPTELQEYPAFHSYFKRYDSYTLKRSASKYSAHFTRPMSCSKPLPPFTFDLLCYLNRDQLERFSIVCRPLKNIIERYFGSKPYRLFDRMRIRRGSYALFHNYAQWHPGREDYSVQQFLAGQKCSIDNPRNSRQYYSFAELRPYLGPTVRINRTILYLAEGDTYNPEHVAEMESMRYLWRDGDIRIENDDRHSYRTRAEDFQLILNSPTILQCRVLCMDDAQFSLKYYEVFYTVNVIVISYLCRIIANDYWLDFLEKPGVKPVVVLRNFSRQNVENLLDRLSKAFSSAVLPNAFKIVFGQWSFEREPLTEFREANKSSAEILELKKEIPMELQEYRTFNSYFAGSDCYTLKRSSIV